jgi:2-methylisocitrate lyase-like PEP mutase family enzyme
MNPMTTQSEKAELLRRLHHGPDILVLPNAWDCASARIFERAGFPAIATTSAGLANSLGYPDEQRITREEMLAAVKKIAARVHVPLTADLEAGYEDIAKTTAGLVDSGAVGLNLEDMDYGGTKGLVEIARQVQKIGAVRRIGDELGVKLVINARTDVYLAQIGDPDSRFGRTCDRSRAYIEAGADCLFIPGVTGEELIGRLVQALKFPINILAVAGTPPVQRLKELGVARVSVGSGIMRATMGLTRQIAQELRTRGTYDKMVEGTIPYAEANRLFES